MGLYDQGMAAAVVRMNELFGNQRGDYDTWNMDRLRNQIEGVRSELIKELDPAYAKLKLMMLHETQYDAVQFESVKAEVRDALCDIMVFALGAFHAVGVNADRDMEEVLDALESRLCKDQETLDATLAFYANKGVEVYYEGGFPHVAVKSSKDQMMPEYPRGKFLKAVTYRQPKFSHPRYDAHFPKGKEIVMEPEVMYVDGGTQRMPEGRRFMGPQLADATQRMAAEREKKMQRDEAWRKFHASKLEELVKAFDEMPDDKRDLLLSGAWTIEMKVKPAAHAVETEGGAL
jgi:hypothetical protein